jgi:hypothetical protein
MGKTLYLIKQKLPDTDADASANADAILNTVLDAMKDLSNNPVANLLNITPALADTHSVTLYEDENKTTQLLKNSDIFVDMFDQQYAVLVSEYQKQTSWDGNDASYSDGTVTHTTNVGYSPAVANYYKGVTSIDPASAPLYDATLFITTDEVNTVYTPDNRYRVIFDTDASGTYQVFKAINSATYRSDNTSGLIVEEVAFNANAGLSETFIVRDLNTNELSLDEDSNPGHKLTSDASFALSYNWNTDVSYGSFKVEQIPAAAGLTITQNNGGVTDVSSNVIHLRDASGFSYLPNSIASDEINTLFSDSLYLENGYTFQLYRTNEGGYYFNQALNNRTTADSNITIDDSALVTNEQYMRLVTNQTAADFAEQYLLWTNGAVTKTGTYAGTVTIGTEAESLNEADSDASGVIIFSASDLTYTSSSSAPQRSEPSNWNNYDTLSVDYANLNEYYKENQWHYLETRVLLPSTNTNTLVNNFNPYETTLLSDSTGRYISASDNLVFFKSDINNTSIDPNNITVNTNGIYDASNINSDYATIFEMGSEKAFTNQSTLLEAIVDGSYIAVPGSIVSIIATNVVIESATDYRFKMNPKKIVDNADASYDFPVINGGFTLLALDSSNQTYAATNYLETLKSNMNIFGNDIYNIMNNDANVDLSIEYKTNGTSINADSLKNFFDISYSFVVDGTTTSGTHRIEDLERMTIIDASLSRIDSSYGALSEADIVGETPTDMLGWKIYQIEEETTFKVRTQLYLGAYSNMYIETPLLRQTDTRYELRTATGVAKPDYYLKYVNPASYIVTAHRALEIAATHEAIPVNRVTLSVNNLKTHIGDIQYTTGVADSDDDNNWITVAGPQDVDPNFDTANVYQAGLGRYKVYIDVPKTYTLDAMQYIIRMQADPTSISIIARKYADSASLFTANNYDWDMTTSPLTGGESVVGLTITTSTAENNDVTLTVFHNGTELFNIVHNGDIVQKIRVIHNPRGIAETNSIIDSLTENVDTTVTYFGSISGNDILYEYADGLTFQLDHRFRDTYSTSSYWTLTQDVATMQRVIGNIEYDDLSGQTIDREYNHSLTYGGSDGAKSVTFTYYRGNANGTASTIDITRTRSTLKYVMATENAASTGGNYGDVWVGRTLATVPDFTIDGVTVTNFGLQIDGISNSIVAGTDATTKYNIYMAFDSFIISEYNEQSEVHNDNITASAGNYVLFAFDGANPLISAIVATTIKSPYDETFTFTKGTTNVYLYYSPVFIGHADNFPDASWSLLSNGILDVNRNTLGANPISYENMTAGIYLNNGAIFLQRLTVGTTTFTGYFVCPPPQLKVTGVVITGSSASYHENISGRRTLKIYNPSTGTFSTQSHYIDVDQVALNTTYYPFANYVSNDSYYMNDLALYEYAESKKSIKSYRDLQTYASRVDIKENKFSIYEYSGMYMSDTSSNSPYDEVDGSYVVLNQNYLSNLSSVYGSVTKDTTYASYTIGIKQNKYPLSQIGGSRYSYENLTFTIGSPFLFEAGLNNYTSESYANRWVPVNTIGNLALPLDFNVGNSTRLTLYGTNFTYSGSNIILRLKKYSTNFGVDYSNFPRELTSVYLFAKNKSYKEISLTRTQLTDENIPDNSTTAEDANAELIRQTLLSVSWTDYEYQTDSFTPGKVRFELVPALSYIYDANTMLDVSANLVDAGAREILSILAVTEDEPRNILFMNLKDSIRSYDGSTYGNYLPKSLTSYSGQSVDKAIPANQDGSAYVIPMKEKFGDSQSIYDKYGH